MTSELKCHKCQKIFKNEKKYQKHVTNVINPCDLKCVACGHVCTSKSGFTRHKKTCKWHEKLEQTINNVSAGINNVDAHNQTNNNNQTNNTNNNNLNQSIVLLQPHGVDKGYMKKTEVMFPVRDIVLNLVKLGKIDEAYETIFNQVHGNEKYPELQNIYLPTMDRDEVAVFIGKNFKLDEWDKRVLPLFDFLRTEMRRFVWGYKDINTLTASEKDKLDYSIKKHWRNVNEHNDINMKRTLFNNKPVVFNTFDKNVVKPHTDMLRSEYIHNGMMPPKDMNREHLVRLIKM